MKFITTISTLGLSVSVLVQAGIVPAEDYDTCEVDTFDGEFALAVKQLGFDYTNAKFLDLIYEMGDGQLEHGARSDQLYPVVLCKYCSLYDNCGENCGQNCGEDGLVKLKETPKIDKRDSVTIPDPGCDEPYCKVCKADFIWSFSLCEGILSDKNYAIGEIVANHQLQFDELSQIDAFHTGGFSITYQYGNYLLALNQNTVFWHCKVNDYGVFKVYNKKIAAQCSPIQLIVLQAKTCKKKYNQTSFPGSSA